MAKNPFCVSLGECGLDYDRMFSPIEAQRLAFEAQVSLAAKLSLPIFVHLRELDAHKGPPLGAFSDAHMILEKYKKSLDSKKVCIHCFTGDKLDLMQLTNCGYSIGFTGYVGMKNRATKTGTLDAITCSESLHLDRVMLETDTPFMKPDKVWFPNLPTTDPTGLRKGRHNEPCGMPAVCRAFSQHYASGHYSASEIANQTTKNSIEFFDLHEAEKRITEYKHL